MYKSFTLLRLAVKQLVLKIYLFSKLLEVLKVNLKYRRARQANQSNQGLFSVLNELNTTLEAK